MPTKKDGRGNYRLYKAELGNMIIHRKTLDEIAERFGVSWTTAKNWRNKYYKEEGTLTPEMKEEMLKEFIVDTRKETELQKLAMLKVLTAPEDQGKAIGASNSITGIHKKELDRLRGIDVLMPEKKDLTIKTLDARGVVEKIEELCGRSTENELSEPENQAVEIIEPKKKIC
jgi:hypothetical protein